MTKLISINNWGWVAGLGVLAPILVSVFALARPYDSVPDQDLLWVSEALRLFRNTPPTYIDHPGAYWTLSFLLKLKVLSFKGILSLIAVRPGLPISSTDATILVLLGRIEQGILCAVLVYSLWLMLKLLGVSRGLSALMTLIYGASSGMLWEAVQIRNESTSALFLFGYINLSLLAAIFAKTNHLIARTLSFAAVAFFLFAIYCKIQVLVLAVFAIPLVIFRTIDVRRVLSHVHKKQIIAEILFSAIVCFLGWIAVTSNWAFAPNPPFNHRLTHFNIALWLYISLGLSICVEACASGHIFSRQNGLVRSSLVIVFIEILFSRVLFHPAWSAQVFLTPASLLGIGTLEEPDVLHNSSVYLKQIFPVLTSAFVGGLILVLALITVRLFLLPRRADTFFAILSIIIGIIIFAATSTRLQAFYGVYYLPPIMLGISAVLAIDNDRRIIINAARLLSLFTLCGLALGSVWAISHWSSYTTIDNTSEHLCFSQQMDRLMVNTSVGGCERFELEMKK